VTKRTGNLRGKPAVIVHGRADTLVRSTTLRAVLRPQQDGRHRPARPSLLRGHQRAALRRFIDNAAAPGLRLALVPLHRYFIQAMDLMYNHLKNGTRSRFPGRAHHDRAAAQRSRPGAITAATCRRSRPRRGAAVDHFREQRVVIPD
jgi:hypothetical protein